MKNRVVGMLAFGVLLTLAAGFSLYFGRPAYRRYSARGIHVSLPSYKAEQVAKISIRWRNVHSVMKLDRGRWVLEERGNRPASVSRISALLASLSSLAPVKELRHVSPEILRELRLIDNDPKVVPGVRVVLEDSNGRELFNMLLGKGHFVRPEPGLPPSADAEGRYVLVGGKVYLIPVVFENCHPIPAVWVEPLRLYELRKALRMTVQRFERGQGKPVWTVYRKSTAHPFTMAYPAGKRAENQLLSGLADFLSKPFSTDYFIPEKGRSLNMKQQLTIHCADGFTYILGVFEGTDKYDIVSLQTVFDPVKVLRFPGETGTQYRKRISDLKKRSDLENSYTAGQYFMTGKELSRMLDVVPEK